MKMGMGTTLPESRRSTGMSTPPSCLILQANQNSLRKIDLRLIPGMLDLGESSWYDLSANFNSFLGSLLSLLRHSFQHWSCANYEYSFGPQLDATS